MTNFLLQAMIWQYLEELELLLCEEEEEKNHKKR
jgi:hypothetical protein